MVYYFIDSINKFHYFTDKDSENIKIDVYIDEKNIYSSSKIIEKDIFYFTELNDNENDKIVKIKNIEDNNIIEFKLNNLNEEKEKINNDNFNLSKMIVIVTHDGDNMLLNLLKDLNNYNIKNSEICIVDNFSKNEEHLKKLKILKLLDYNVLYNNNDTYELGAFKIAYENLNADMWFLLQDSIRIKKNIFNMIIPKLNDNNLYTLLTFNIPQLILKKSIYEFLFKYFKKVSYRNGIFGNMFFAKNNVINKFYNDLIIPRNKEESMFMEIGLSIIMNNNNINIHGLDIVDKRVNVDTGFDSYSFFSKISMHKNR